MMKSALVLVEMGKFRKLMSGIETGSLVRSVLNTELKPLSEASICTDDCEGIETGTRNRDGSNRTTIL
jgi:hypothetical protein